MFGIYCWHNIMTKQNKSKHMFVTVTGYRVPGVSVSFTLRRAVHAYQINLTEIYTEFTLIQVGARYSTNNKREIFIWHHQR